MAQSNWSQFVLLLWKNWLLQKRRPVVTALQIIFPTLFAIVMLLIRTAVKAKFVEDPTIRDGFDPLTFPNLTLPTPPSRPMPGSNLSLTTDEPNNLTLPSSYLTTFPPNSNLTFHPNLTSFLSTPMPQQNNLSLTPNELSPANNLTLSSNASTPAPPQDNNLAMASGASVPPPWVLVYSPNTSTAASWIASQTAKTLNMKPSPVGMSPLAACCFMSHVCL